MNQLEPARLAEEVQRSFAGTGLPEPGEVARRIRDIAGVISDVEVVAVMRELQHSSVGLGALEPLLSRPGVTDIVVNAPDEVFIDTGAGLERAAVHFADDAAVRSLATRLVTSTGGRLDAAQPFADAQIRRDDGTIVRVHALLAPIAGRGTCLSLRVLRHARHSLEDLEASGSVHPEAGKRLRDIVYAREPFLVVGGTGTGKTTLLSALLGQVDPRERVLIVEDTPELRPDHPHCVFAATRGKNVEGFGEVTLTTLVRQALRMRPDRIVLGEIRGPEIVDLLMALNTGHDGGAGTIHANALAEVPARIAALCALGGLVGPACGVQVAAALRHVVVMSRGRDGSRQVAQLGSIGLNARGELTTTTQWEAPCTGA